MSQTIIGMLITRDGAATQTYLHEPEPRRAGDFSVAYLRQPVEVRRRFYILRALEVRSVQAAWIPINLDHDPDRDRHVGQVEHLEWAADGSLWMVGHVAGSLPTTTPQYLSPRTTSDRDGNDVAIEHVAIVKNPAQILIPPVDVVDADLLTLRVDRADRHAGILARAAEASRHRGRHDPIRVVDTDPARAGVRQLGDVQADERTRPPGPIRYGPPGRVLSVR